MYTPSSAASYASLPSSRPFSDACGRGGAGGNGFSWAIRNRNALPKPLAAPVARSRAAGGTRLVVSLAGVEDLHRAHRAPHANLARKSGGGARRVRATCCEGASQRRAARAM